MRGSIDHTWSSDVHCFSRHSDCYFWRSRSSRCSLSASSGPTSGGWRSFAVLLPEPFEQLEDWNVGDGDDGGGGYDPRVIRVVLNLKVYLKYLQNSLNNQTVNLSRNSCIWYRGQFHKHFTHSFYARRSQNRKKRQSGQADFFFAFGICACKSCL